MQKYHSVVDKAANNIHSQLAVSILPKTKPDQNVLNFRSLLLHVLCYNQAATHSPTQCINHIVDVIIQSFEIIGCRNNSCADL
jgi:hypothetical protein